MRVALSPSPPTQSWQDDVFHDSDAKSFIAHAAELAGLELEMPASLYRGSAEQRYSPEFITDMLNGSPGVSPTASAVRSLVSKGTPAESAKIQVRTKAFELIRSMGLKNYMDMQINSTHTGMPDALRTASQVLFSSQRLSISESYAMASWLRIFASNKRTSGSPMIIMEIDPSNLTLLPPTINREFLILGSIPIRHLKSLFYGITKYDSKGVVSKWEWFKIERSTSSLSGLWDVHSYGRLLAGDIPQLVAHDLTAEQVGDVLASKSQSP